MLTKYESFVIVGVSAMPFKGGNLVCFF